MTVETRYFQTGSSTVNGLLARKLLTSQGGVATYIVNESNTAQIGIQVWKRTSGGVETEITAGSPVAVATWDEGIGTAIYSATWNCPQTSLASTDSIVIRVYTADTLVLYDVWSTEPLTATQLDAATWTVYYYLVYNTSFATLRFYFDTATYDSKISNFSYSTPAGAAAVAHYSGDGLYWSVVYY